MESLSSPTRNTYSISFSEKFKRDEANFLQRTPRSHNSSNTSHNHLSPNMNHTHSLNHHTMNMNNSPMHHYDFNSMNNVNANSAALSSPKLHNNFVVLEEKGSFPLPPLGANNVNATNNSAASNINGQNNSLHPNHYLSSPTAAAGNAILMNTSVHNSHNMTGMNMGMNINNNTSSLHSPRGYSHLLSSPPSNTNSLASPTSSSTPSNNLLSPGKESHRRRPSFMQSTQQELQRQAELREIQEKRLKAQAEEREKSTRKAKGLTSTDLYMQSQRELESKRQQQLEKEELERAAERAKLLAKLDGDANSYLIKFKKRTSSDEATVTNISHALASNANMNNNNNNNNNSNSNSNSNSNNTNHLSVNTSAHPVNGHTSLTGSPTSHSSPHHNFPISPSNHHVATQMTSTSTTSNGADSSEILASDLTNNSSTIPARTIVVLKTPRQPSLNSISISSNGSNSYANDRVSTASSVQNATSPRSATNSSNPFSFSSTGTISTTAVAPAKHRKKNHRNKDHQADSQGEDDESSEDELEEEPAPLSAMPIVPPPLPAVSSTLTAEEEDDIEDEEKERSSRRPSCVSDLYDPAFAKGRGGFELLLESTKFRKKKEIEKQKRNKEDISASFARPTVAQLERTVDQMEKKHKIDARNERIESRAQALALNQQQKEKKSFFPSLWKKMTGT